MHRRREQQHGVACGERERAESGRNETTYELGERFPSGVSFCFAAFSPSTTGALGDVVREVAEADLRSAWTSVCVEGASVGKEEEGLESGSD